MYALKDYCNLSSAWQTSNRAPSGHCPAFLRSRIFKYPRYSGDFRPGSKKTILALVGGRLSPCAASRWLSWGKAWLLIPALLVSFEVKAESPSCRRAR